MFFYKKNKKLNVMVWNCSSVDHALVKKLKQSKLLKNLYIANSDDDLKQYGEILEEKSTALIRKCKEKGIDLVISNWVANDSGIIDAFSLIGIPGIGVNKYWTKLEASKEFGKLFMRQHNIQTANYVVMTNIDEAIKYLKRTSYPIVVKADGYSKGKGSFVCQNYTEAFDAVKKILNKEIETTTQKLLIEDFLQGTEVTLMCFWDGRTLLPMLPIKDYKRLLENDKGPNTGSMGSFIPFSLPSLYKTYIKKY